MAALAIPFLIIDSPSPAEGVETSGATESALVETVTSSTTTTTVAPAAEAAAEVVVTAAVSPDITRLADQAGAWAAARADAVADGLVERTPLVPPSDTNLSLLPVVDTTPATTTTTDAPEADVEETSEPDPVVEETPDADGEAVDPDADAGTADPDAEEVADGEAADPVEEEVEPVPPTPEEIDQQVEDAAETLIPTAPTQVNGRVPVPAGGPTAEQWDAVRKCESTHNYEAISPSGLYRGAYQFSQVTWDWVAGIHQPHLVGIDPIDAEPAWQDVMAYTLFAMRGWDQWPVCGVALQ